MKRGIKAQYFGALGPNKIELKLHGADQYYYELKFECTQNKVSQNLYLYQKKIAYSSIFNVLHEIYDITF